MRRWLLALAAVALVTGCRLDLTVSVRMDEDGAGTVRVVATADAELADRAARFGGADPAAIVRTGDLERAGWTVTRDPAEHRITIEHPFTNPAEVGPLLASLGPAFTGFDATRERSVFSARYEIRGRVDLTTVEPLDLQGLDPALVREVAAADVAPNVAATVFVDLPGRTEEVAVAPGASAEVLATASSRNTQAVLLAAGTLAAAVITLGALVAVLTSRGRQ